MRRVRIEILAATSLCQPRIEARSSYFIPGFFRAPCSAVLGAEAHASHGRKTPAAKPQSRATHREPLQRACPLTAARAKGTRVHTRKGDCERLLPPSARG